jgi:hypothetical protein
MLGWREISTDPESEQVLSDPFMRGEGGTSQFELGPSAGGAMTAIEASYDPLDANLVLPIDTYGHTGWLLVA